MTNYEDILNSTVENLPKTQDTPNGSWLLRLKNATLVKPKTEGKSPRVLFFYNPKEPMDDVDAEGLEAGQAAGYDFSQNDVVAQFFAAKPKDWEAIVRHLELHGIQTAGTGKSLQQLLKDAGGEEVYGFVTTQSYVNEAGQEIRSDVASQFTPVA